MSTDLRVTDAVVIDGADLSFAAVRSSGPGGQHVNTSSTKVELRFDLEACQALSDAAKGRLRSLARGRFDSDGRLLIVSQATRSQRRNMEDARTRLADLIRQALVAPRQRRPTRPTAGSRRRRLDAKRQLSEKKRARGRVDD
ncbi:MAG: aminoacyl-tRNA hydrolase [Deltaproteobacteria bacterium HGW-Deltaproteobacteria-14]|jgi:ribosome-associated protein|nr:MAG: aminoacyl-tRNA hydrolase [Deltaproteobacteria bacterium HGW-Deltaproteobacteria-14]